MYFDSEGMFGHGSKRQKAGTGSNFHKFGIFAVLLNLDDKSPNANTISLFRDGVRVCQPKPIPENLVGKPLFPTVTFKNMTLELNLGPTALAALEFNCRMISGAAKADLKVLPSTKPADGKYEVVFPVGLPDRGLFDWVDSFLEENPGYTELSDRRIIDWATKSGFWRPKNTDCNDKPTMRFGMDLMDNNSVRRALNNFAPTQRRHFVVAELKANLTKADREKGLKKFRSRHFKTTAAVVMGQPDNDFKARVHTKLLAAKQAKADAEKRKEAAAAKRKKLVEESRKRQEAKRAKKAQGEDAKKADGEEKKAAEEANQEDDEEADAKVEEDVAEEAAPPVELTEEEKAVCFPKSALPDLLDRTLSQSYANFALPEEEEGFNTIKYHWNNESACAEVLKSYIMERNLSQRVEELQPGAWFK